MSSIPTSTGTVPTSSTSSLDEAVDEGGVDGADDAALLQPHEHLEHSQLLLGHLAAGDRGEDVVGQVVERAVADQGLHHLGVRLALLEV